MKKQSSVPCVLSLIFGASGFPLYAVLLLMRVLYLNRTLGPFSLPTYEAEMGFMPTAIVMYIIIALIAVAGLVTGIICIAQKRPTKGMAIAGVIVSAVIIIFPLFFFGLGELVFPPL